MSFRTLFVMVALTVLCAVPTPAAETGNKKAASSKTEKDSKVAKETKQAKDAKSAGDADKSADEAGPGDSFNVVQVGYEVKVVKNSELAALKEKVNEDFKKALQTYEDAKKAATKAKKKFTENKPVKPVVKTLFTALKSLADANSKRDKEAQRLEAQKKKAKEDASK